MCDFKNAVYDLMNVMYNVKNVVCDFKNVNYKNTPCVILKV